jgi:hypothetical protein
VFFLQLSTLTKLRDLRLKVREIDVDGIDALRALTDLRSFDLEVRLAPCLQSGSMSLVAAMRLLCTPAHLRLLLKRQDLARTRQASCMWLWMV